MLDPLFECIAADDGSAFRVMHSRCSNLKDEHSWHFHPEYEMSWVIRSCGTRYVGNYAKPYIPGEVVLYGPNLPHCSINDPGPYGDEVEHITIQFDPLCFGEGFLAVPEAAGIRAMLADSKRAILFSPEAAHILGAEMRNLTIFSGMKRLLKLAQILEEVSRLPRHLIISPHFLRENCVDAKFLGRLNEVHRYIFENFRDNLCQAEIAARVGLSSAAFSKFIRAATGRTFMSMVKDARINEAARLLATTSQRITDIALDCGYQHTSHFDRHFAERKGVSPTEYRRHMRALEAA